MLSSQQYISDNDTDLMLQMPTGQRVEEQNWGILFQETSNLCITLIHNLIVKWTSIMHIKIRQHKIKIQHKMLILFSKSQSQRRK